MGIKWYKSKNNSDGPLNGGCISSEEVEESSFKKFDNKNRQKEGHRKLFVKLVDDDCSSIKNTRIFIKYPGFLGDLVTLSYGNNLDTQNNLYNNRDQYGVGMLDNDLKKGDFEIIVRIDLHNDNIPKIFRSGDLIYIASRLEIGENCGQFVRINKNHPVKWNGNFATIRTETQILKDFKKGRNIISSVLELGDLNAEAFGYNIRNKKGKYDVFGEYLPVKVKNNSSIDQKWTITFSDECKFICEGVGPKSVGKTEDGDIRFPFEPKNPFTGEKLFSINPFFGVKENWSEGDQISFHTRDSSKSFWQTLYLGKHNVSGKREYQLGFSGQVE